MMFFTFSSFPGTCAWWCAVFKSFRAGQSRAQCWECCGRILSRGRSSSTWFIAREAETPTAQWTRVAVDWTEDWRVRRRSSSITLHLITLEFHIELTRDNVFTIQLSFHYWKWLLMACLLNWRRYISWSLRSQIRAGQYACRHSTRSVHQWPDVRAWTLNFNV